MRLLILCAMVLVTAPTTFAGEDAVKKARAALAVEMAKQQPSDPLPEMRSPVQAARAAMAEAMGRPCDCGLCPASKPMPTATKQDKPAETKPVEKMSYKELLTAVGQLQDGEALRVYVGQSAVADSGRVVELTDVIPGEPMRVGVWRVWSKDGTPTMQLHHPEGQSKRVAIGGYWYDQYPDGSRFWCVACNKGR